jgi:hypothetical protein
MAEPLDELFARARGVRAPVGARERVLARTERALAERPRAAARKLAFAAFALVFVSAAASALWLAPVWRAPARAPAPAEPHEGRARKPAAPEPAPKVEPQTVGEPQPEAAQLEEPARARSALSPGPSELALQVKAYRQALALRGRDDARAIEQWRAMTRRWPHSPLRHEIDLSVIDALARLGRAAEARSEARRFLDRHPGSAKAPAIREMLGE